MVAVISTGKSIYGALAYNEKKVEQGDAVSLGVVNSMARGDRQSLAEKSRSLQNLADRNLRTKRNSVHIALSFAKGDQLDEHQLRSIAKEYLKGIGFEGQPAYLYRHQDTANDHIHIVTTNITREGKRIDDSFVGATKSEVTRKKIEVAYGLVKAEEQGEKRSAAKQLSLQGPPPTGDDQGELRSYARHTIRETLRAYKPATVGELNALLRERGLKLRQEKGTTGTGEAWQGYSIVRIEPRTGQESSAAIKASKVFEAQWGTKLEKVLVSNGKSAERVLPGVRAKVKEAFGDERASTGDIKAHLENASIRIIHHYTAEGRRFGVHYLDAESGHLFKASQVGRKYTAAEWNRREEVNTLSTEDYKKLVGDVKQYLDERQRAADGFQSVVIKEMETAEQLHFAMIQQGHNSQLIGPYLNERIASERKDYEGAMKRDGKHLKDLYWGLAQLRQEYRTPVMQVLGLARQGEEIVLKSNTEVRVDARQLEEEGGVKDLAINTLSAQERRMLIGVGRYRGIGGIPLEVNLGSIDWKYWEGKFKPLTAEKLGKQLHDNYVKKELYQLDKEGGSVGQTQPLIRLAGKGILIRPTENGYRAHLVGQERYELQVPRNITSRLYREDYRTEHYESMRSLLGDKVAAQTLAAVQEAQRATISGSVTRSEVRSKVRILERGLMRYLSTQGNQVSRRGLYQLLDVMDEDEKLSYEERKQTKGLKI